MKSPFTGKEMKLVREKRTLTFRKETFEFIHQAYQCEETGEQFTTTELDEINTSQVYNQFREKHNIPFPEEIKNIRNKYNLPAAKMSEILGFGPNTYRQYEDGEVPQISNARSIQSAKSPSSFKNFVNLCDSLDAHYKQNLIQRIDKIEHEEQRILQQKNIETYLIGEPVASKFTGYKIPSIEKFAAMVHLFASSIKPYKTKLNKLLFYADFAMFKNYGCAISGVKYKAIQLGPVPDNFQSIFEYLQKQGNIHIEYYPYQDGNVGEQFLPIDHFQIDEHILSDLELKTIMEVIEKFKNDSTQEIIQKSHEEKPWIDNYPTKEIISYFDSFELKHI
jgi:putative zinc finger/helix-turn-helix YgiT family protein